MKTAALIVLMCTLLAPPASADLRDVGRFTYGWTLKGVGGLSMFILHELCHVATTRAYGGRTKRERSTGVLWVRGMSDQGHRATAWAGNTCTAIASEVIIINGWHRKSHLAWGALTFHSWNSLAYAGASQYGTNDKGHFVRSGGNPTTWTALHYAHGSRTTVVLFKDFDMDFMTNKSGRKF